MLGTKIEWAMQAVYGKTRPTSVKRRAERETNRRHVHVQCTSQNRAFHFRVYGRRSTGTLPRQVRHEDEAPLPAQASRAELFLLVAEASDACVTAATVVLWSDGKGRDYGVMPTERAAYQWLGNRDKNNADTGCEGPGKRS